MYTWALSCGCQPITVSVCIAGNVVADFVWPVKLLSFDHCRAFSQSIGIYKYYTDHGPFWVFDEDDGIEVTCLRCVDATRPSVIPNIIIILSNQFISFVRIVVVMIIYGQRIIGEEKKNERFH